MATLRSILATTTGLYCEPESGQRFQRDDLMVRLSEEDLDASVDIRKMGPGVYRLQLHTEPEQVYELYSRRREERREAATASDS